MPVRSVRLDIAFCVCADNFDTLGLGLPLAIAIIWICWCLEALNLI